MIEGLHKAFESRVRLGIMAVLTVNDEVEHGPLKELLSVTDGNLASHMAALVAITQHGSTRSLNAGAAAAIAMYEWARHHA